MFILLGYVSLALVELYRSYMRRMQYSRMMLRALRSGSILVQRGKGTQHGSVGTLFNTSLLSCSQSYKETQLLSDEYLTVSLVSPKQQVDLGEWVSYLDMQASQNGRSMVVALLEAGTAVGIDTTALQVPPAYRVHVLKHGCPLAWKAGSPFGIILLCSCKDFVILCDAFGQAQLTLDEGVQVNRILTISTAGKPKSLRKPKEIPMLDKEDIVKTRHASTDPIKLPVSSDMKSPLCVTVAAESHEDRVRVRSAEFDTSSTAKAKAREDYDIVKQVETLSSRIKTGQGKPVSEVMQHSGMIASEKSLNTVSDELNSMPVYVSRVLGNAVIIEEDCLKFQESPLLSMSEGASDGLGKNAQSLSMNTIAKPDQNYFLSIAANDYSIKSDMRPSDLNGKQEKSDSLSSGITPSVSDFHKFCGTTGNDDSGSVISSQAFEQRETLVSVSQQHAQASDNENKVGDEPGQYLNASDNVSTSSKQEIKAVNVSQQNIKKDGDLTVSVEQSSGGGVISVQSPEASQDTNIAGTTEKCDYESSLSLNGRERKNLMSKSSSNGMYVSDSTSNDSQTQTGGEPPNVVVYCGKKDSARKFDIIKRGLQKCLNTSAYTVYLLPHEDVVTMPWEDTSSALIISHDYLHDNIKKKCTDFLLKGGKVISFGSSMEAEFLVRREMKDRPGITRFNLEKWHDVSAVQGRYHYVPGSLTKGNSSMDTLVVDPKSGDPLVVRLMLSPEHGNGQAIFSQLFLERDPSEMAADSKAFNHLKQSNKDRVEVLRYLLSLLDLDTSETVSEPLTPCYILVEDQAVRKSFLDSIAGRMKDGSIRSRYLTLNFVSSKSRASSLIATNDTLPVVMDVSAGSCKGTSDAKSMQYFDPEVYWHHLTSSVLGHVVMYTEIIPTTMTVFDGIQHSLPEDVGVIAVAGRQTSGKGRGGNTWLSPVGCAMFTLPLQLPVDTYLGQRISFLQHIASLSVVHAVRSMPDYEDLDLRLKWPNDIYYGNKSKLGGVLVKSSIMGNTVYAIIGCGVNVSNTQPTVCINSIIQQHNDSLHLNLKPLTTSEVLARTVSTMEILVAQFQDKGHLDFCQLYYKYWLHRGARVKVESEGSAEVEICGLDNFGFLQVINKQGQELSVQPDGNSFDMLRNLITVKRD